MGKPMADSCIEINENYKAITLQLKIDLKKKQILRAKINSPIILSSHSLTSTMFMHQTTVYM